MEKKQRYEIVRNHRKPYRTVQNYRKPFQFEQIS